MTHLTPYTTKTYINISPQNTLQERNLPAVFLAENMQNKPNSTTQYDIRNTQYETKTNPIAIHSPIYAKRTQFNQREKRDEKMKNEPNLKLMCLKAPKRTQLQSQCRSETQIRRGRNAGGPIYSFTQEFIRQGRRQSLSTSRVYRRVGFTDESGLSAKGGPRADQGRTEGGLRWGGLIHPFMQNEPNYNPHASKNPINHSRPKSQTRYGGVESTNNQLSILEQSGNPPLEESISKS